MANTGQEARAAFELNFLPSPDIIAGSQSFEQTYARCNMGAIGDNNWCHRNGGPGTPDPDKTPFLRELISVNGISYVHMIVGSLTPDPVTGEVFAQETYIRVSGGGYSSSGGKPGCNGPVNICGGAVNPVISGNGQVAGGGSLGTPLVGDQHTTGIGTGDPTRAIIRQVMKSSEIDQEFLKADLLLKPKITQTINSSDGIMSSNVVLDMSLINYNTNASGVMTNKLTLNDPQNPLPAGSGFFDAVASAQSSNVTGGRYTFTPGAGWVDATVHLSYRAGNPFSGPIVPEDNVWVYDAGSYAYDNGGSADITNVDWQAFRNPLENP